ncbi:hypothetical protein ADUPG1_013711 [Aduncisulcus paluster]|uniref:FRIGIDA-like protein n=1 Tax=Aduncisulcus paluster TaxID=2918883 RepID=A0ABQ5K3W4_9EUKA|nr:hypothetical protein ADUPG1_013711 [Aduncisulcus paluster]
MDKEKDPMTEIDERFADEIVKNMDLSGVSREMFAKVTKYILQSIQTVSEVEKRELAKTSESTSTEGDVELSDTKEISSTLDEMKIEEKKDEDGESEEKETKSKGNKLLEFIKGDLSKRDIDAEVKDMDEETFKESLKGMAAYSYMVALNFLPFVKSVDSTLITFLKKSPHVVGEERQRCVKIGVCCKKVLKEITQNRFIEAVIYFMMLSDLGELPKEYIKEYVGPKMEELEKIEQEGCAAQ